MRKKKYSPVDKVREAQVHPWVNLLPCSLKWAYQSFPDMFMFMFMYLADAFIQSDLQMKI